MKSINTDKKLRDALYTLYVAQFDAIKAYPDAFDKNHANRMLTALMGSRPWSWRVTGITPEALALFAEHDFKRPARLIQRGHRSSRSDTAQALFYDIDTPLPKEDFFKLFLKRDETVLMLASQNPARSKNKSFPAFIRIPRSKGLFPCGSLVGWQHRDEEINFLRELHHMHKG